MTQLEWDATIRSIRDSVPTAQFHNWIKPLKLIRSDERSVVLGVPNPFHEEWLKTHYANKLSHAINRNCGTELQLEFEILLEEQNIEAVRSNPIEENTLKGPPVLRVIDGVDTESLTPPPRKGIKPTLPPFNHPYWEFEFNKVASRCAQIISDGKSLPMNPLVVVAGVGMGKTHLLSEIGKKLHLTDGEINIRYVNAEAFTTEVYQGFANRTYDQFRKKYREQTDVLLFDDVQSLSKRIKTQEALLHIFDELVTRGGKVIFTSKVPPHKLEEFIEPLKSRILSGVIAEISSPSYEEKVQLLKLSAKENRIDCEEGLIRSLADRGQKDVRELLGSLIRLHLQSQLENRPFNLEFLSRKGWQQELGRQKVTMEEIISIVESSFEVTRMDLHSKSRKSNVTWARQVAMYLGRHYTLLPLETIGKIFGRDHATVIHSFDKVVKTMNTQPSRKYEIEFLMEKLSSRTRRT